MASLRERLRAAAAKITVDAVLFTTFNFDADFFEENVLPALLGVDADVSIAARRAAVHQRLYEVDVGVCFDGTVARPSPREYRYTAYPVLLPGRYFHPKNIILFGRDHANKYWLYISAASANLTLSGWGSNMEGLADVWIHAQSQQPWYALSEFLHWLGKELHLPRAGHPMARIREAMEQMQHRRSVPDPEGRPWKEIENVALYFSPLHTGFWDVMSAWGTPQRMTIASPYWGNVADNLREFGNIQTELIPARLPMKTGTGLTANDATRLDPKQVCLSRWRDEDERFRHLKCFRFEYAEHRVMTAMGSCNFTQMGLRYRDNTGRETGNVESMLLIGHDVELFDRLPLQEDWLAGGPEGEEGAPEPAPFTVLVRYDWKARSYYWVADQATLPTLATLTGLVGLDAIDLVQEPHGQRHCPSGPRTGRMYRVEYLDASGERRTWYGWIVETNLEYSTKLFGYPLHPDEIIASWRVSGDVDPLVPTDPDEANMALEQEASAGVAPWQQTQAPAFNFHHFYRGVRERECLLGSATEEACRQWLITRPDSVFALASAIREQSSLPVRFLVLTECYRLLKAYGSERKASHLKELHDWLNDVRFQIWEMIRDELSAIGHPADPDQVVQWFERRLQHWGDEQ